MYALSHSHAMTDEQTDEALLADLQRAAFGYFIDTVRPATGLVTDTSRAGAPVSIAVVGFALSAIQLPSSAAVDASPCHRAQSGDAPIPAASEQSDGPTATGYKGSTTISR
jgi:hypothetical protein